MNRTNSIVIGDKSFFTKWLEVNDIPTRTVETHALWQGLPVIESKYTPKDRAILIDDRGMPVKIFNLKTWRTKKEIKTI